MLKKFLIGLMAISLIVIFGQTVSAQTVSNTAAKTSVKSLKKSLSKNSRFGNEVIYWFKPLEFEDCQVSFRFSRLNESGNDLFANLNFDRNSGVYRNDTVRLKDLPVYTSQSDYQMGVRPQTDNSSLRVVKGQTNSFQNQSFQYFSSGLSRRGFLTESFVTYLDLSMIDANTIKIEENEKGQFFVVFNSLKDKTAIGKMFIGGNELIKLENDFIPVTGEKSGGKSSEKLIEAVKACQP